MALECSLCYRKPSEYHDAKLGSKCRWPNPDNDSVICTGIIWEEADSQYNGPILVKYPDYPYCNNPAHKSPNHE